MDKIRKMKSIFSLKGWFNSARFMDIATTVALLIVLFMTYQMLFKVPEDFHDFISLNGRFFGTVVFFIIVLLIRMGVYSHPKFNRKIQPKSMAIAKLISAIKKIQIKKSSNH